MIFITYIIVGSGPAIMEATGIPAAHLYDFLARLYPEFGGGRKWISTPRFVSSWFAGRDGGRSVQKGYGTAIRPVEQTPRASSSSWGSRGQGRRLGGE